MCSCGRTTESICQHMLFPDGGMLPQPRDRRAKTGAAERESNVDANDKFVAVLYLLWWLEGYFNVKDDESLRNEGKNGILFRGGGRSPQVLRIGSLQSDGY